MLKKMKAAFVEARRSVKKRIKQAKSDATMQERDEERNMFDLFMYVAAWSFKNSFVAANCFLTGC